ncbi:MAG: hypothetical protein ACJ8KA_09500 [Sulfurifustis sp.]
MPARVLLVVLMALLPAVATAASGKAAASGKSKAPEAKELSGMSIVGNNETPKALYIVPWKGSEIGDGADVTSGLLNDAMAPVDREVFLRELQYYEISQGK